MAKPRQRRVWLNSGDDQLAALAWNVDKGPKYTSAWLTIRDCNRQVQLDFCTGYGEDDTRVERIKKLDIIIDELKKMRKAMVG